MKKLLYYDDSFLKKLVEINFPLKNKIKSHLEFKNILTNVFLCDRTDSGFNIFPMKYSNIPEAKSIDLDDCMDRRAQELNMLSGKKIILWSGGIDSTALLVSMMKRNEINNYEICYTKTSIEEYPWFFEKYIRNSNSKFLDVKNNVNVFYNDIFNDGDIDFIITGYNGDHIFGVDYNCVTDKSISLESDWKVALNLVGKELEVFIESVAKKSPYQIKTIEDLYHYIYFVFDWNYDIYNNGLLLKDVSKIKKHIPFYDTEYFQSWRLYHFDSLKIHSWDNMKNNKFVAKKYIYDFTKEKDYFKYKQKEISTKKLFSDYSRHNFHNYIMEDFSSGNIKYMKKIDFLKLLNKDNKCFTD